MKNLFPVFKSHKELIYLDSAASALKLGDVITSLVSYYEQSGSNIGRGGYEIAHDATESYEQTREVVKRFINAKDVSEIIFTKGCTQSLNMVAHHYQYILKKGDEIITSELEHHASYMPWQRVAKETEATLIYASLDKDFRIDTHEVLKQINENTKIVALTYVSNVMGYITDVKPIIKKAHQYGAVVIIDAAQAMSHIPVDVIDLDCDYLAFSAHKLFGPTGLGVLYGKHHLLKDLRPMEVGGGMVDTLTKTEQTYQELPQRLEAGTPPIAEVIAFKASLEFIKTLGFDKISVHIKDIHTYALDQISKIDGVKVYNPKADIGIITFNIEGIHAHDAQSFFSEAHIAVRTGNHCARLLQPVLGVNASIRASIHIYNSKKDIDALCTQIKHIRDFFRGLDI